MRFFYLKHKACTRTLHFSSLCLFLCSFNCSSWWNYLSTIKTMRGWIFSLSHLTSRKFWFHLQILVYLKASVWFWKCELCSYTPSMPNCKHLISNVISHYFMDTQLLLGATEFTIFWDINCKLTQRMQLQECFLYIQHLTFVAFPREAYRRNGTQFDNS